MPHPSPLAPDSFLPRGAASIKAVRLLCRHHRTSAVSSFCSHSANRAAQASHRILKIRPLRCVVHQPAEMLSHIFAHTGNECRVSVTTDRSKQRAVVLCAHSRAARADGFGTEYYRALYLAARIYIHATVNCLVPCYIYEQR